LNKNRVEKRYITDRELAAAFGVSRRTTARWRDDGTIGFIKLPGGKKVLYLFSHVWDFQQRFEQPAARPRGRPRKE
jgi:excisionase family DNA binding protein